MAEQLAASGVHIQGSTNFNHLLRQLVGRPAPASEGVDRPRVSAMSEALEPASSSSPTFSIDVLRGLLAGVPSRADSNEDAVQSMPHLALMLKAHTSIGGVAP